MSLTVDLVLSGLGGVYNWQGDTRFDDQERYKVTSQTDHPHSRFLLHYSPTATSPALALVASGQDPIVPQWKEQLEKLRDAGEAVAFGYGEVRGKGCVLHYLSDKMA